MASDMKDKNEIYRSNKFVYHRIEAVLLIKIKFQCYSVVFKLLLIENSTLCVFRDQITEIFIDGLFA